MSSDQGRSGVGSQDTRVGHAHAFTTDQVARMVIEAREQVVRRAYGHRQFSGLSRHDVEELFDSTTEIVIRDPSRYVDADHVQASLWRGMHMRALDVFRRRKRRGFEADPALLDIVADDLGEHDERIARDQNLLVVRDFLAALTPREAEVWKLTQGEDLSVLQTSKRLAISRHAVGEHLDAATRKLEVFAALYDAGQWCGRRQTDITRVLAGAEDEGTLRRALAHLDACAVCRRANAARVRETGRIAAGVLPMPALLGGDHGRGLLERVVDLLPQIGGGGGGRTEAAAGAVFGGGLAGVTKVGAIVATTATVAVGAGTVVDRSGSDDRAREPKAAVSARSLGAEKAPAPVAAVVRAPTPAPPPARRTAARSSSTSSTAARGDESQDVFALGTVESAPPPATSASAIPTPTPQPEPAPERPGQEQFLP